MPDITYEVRLSGLLPDEALEDFDDFRVTTTGACTVLSGSVIDQSALLGLLARLRALGMEVVEFRRVPSTQDVEPGGEST